jgi:hypothetical protein
MQSLINLKTFPLLHFSVFMLYFVANIPCYYLQIKHFILKERRSGTSSASNNRRIRNTIPYLSDANTSG